MIPEDPMLVVIQNRREIRQKSAIYSSRFRENFWRPTGPRGVPREIVTVRDDRLHSRNRL
jgi:hypothetical protein